MIQIFASDYEGSKCNPLPIAYMDEHIGRTIVFNLAEFRDAYGGGAWTIRVKRPGETIAYFAQHTWESEEGYACWDVDEVDSAIEGIGEVQLTYYPFEGVYGDNERGKTRIWLTQIKRSIMNMGEVPPSAPDVLDQIAHFASEAESAVVRASTIADNAMQYAENSEASAVRSKEYADSIEGSVSLAEQAAAEAMRYRDEARQYTPEGYQELVERVAEVEGSIDELSEYDKTQDRRFGQLEKRTSNLEKAAQGQIYDTDEVYQYVSPVAVPSNSLPACEMLAVGAMSERNPISDGVAYTNGKYLGEDGQLRDNADLKVSDFIDVEPNKTYVITANKESGSNSRFHVYQSNGTWVEQIKVLTTEQSGVITFSITIPSNATKLRWSVRLADTVTVYDGIRTNIADSIVHGGRYESMLTDVQKAWLNANYTKWHNDTNVIMYILDGDIVVCYNATNFVGYSSSFQTYGYTVIRANGNVEGNKSSSSMSWKISGNYTILYNNIVGREVSSDTTIGIPKNLADVKLPNLTSLNMHGVKDGVDDYVDFEPTTFYNAKKAYLKDLTWEYNGTRFKAVISDAVMGVSNVMPNLLSDRYFPRTAETYQENKGMTYPINGASGILFFDTDYTDLDSFKASLGDSFVIYESTDGGETMERYLLHRRCGTYTFSGDENWTYPSPTHATMPSTPLGAKNGTTAILIDLPLQIVTANVPTIPNSIGFGADKLWINIDSDRLKIVPQTTGKTLIYELATPQTLDVTDLVNHDVFDNLIDVEQNGSLHLMDGDREVNVQSGFRWYEKL